ncbi:hypothetical protein [Wenyingzhuangia sp. IMCC45574]
MSKHIDSKKIQETLRKISKHNLFVNAPTHLRILTYLVEKAIKVEDVTEKTIGIDLFGESYTSTKTGGTIRSYMSKLRKKLENYYNEVGKAEDLVFFIPKGQYNLRFIPHKDFKKIYKTQTTYNFSLTLKSIYISITIILLSMATVFLIQKYYNNHSLIWEPFFENNAKNMVIISDQYMVNVIDKQYNEKHPTVYPINSQNDYVRYVQENPDRNLEATDYTLMSKMAPYGVKLLTEWFTKNNSNYLLQLESKLTYNDISNYNLLFIGQYKTMNLSNSFFLKKSNCFSLYKDGFQYEKDNTKKRYNTQRMKNGRVEYAMVSFTSFTKGKQAFYFVSNNDIGTMATLRYFTQKESLKKFIQLLPDRNTSFNALFKVSGLQRNDISCELVELEVIQK